jgi:hypothetical protein
VDQSVKGGQWNKLVQLPFDKSHSSSITISPLGFKFKIQGLWAADAFRLTWHGKSCRNEDVLDVPSQVPDKARFPLLQEVMDNLDAKVKGVSREAIWQCPASTGRHFGHDTLRKDIHAEAVYLFDPPQDGCYLVEEKHPECHAVASDHTKVHVQYGKKPLRASGTVDQTAIPGGEPEQWNFIASLQFYAGHPGNVTLSNEGTDPSTIAVFDQIRFTRTGKDCMDADAHPRRAQFRMTVDFDHVAKRLGAFGPMLKFKLAQLANVPEKLLRLVGLRDGSIIAEFLVLPSLVDEPLAVRLTPKQTIAKIREAVEKDRVELCGLTQDFGVLYMRGCHLELKDLGYAMPTIRAPKGKAPKGFVLEEGTPIEETQEEEETKAGGGGPILIIAISAIVGALFMAGIAAKCHKAKINWTNRKISKEGIDDDIQTFKVEPAAFEHPEVTAMPSMNVERTTSSSSNEKPNQLGVIAEDDKSTCAGSESGDIDKRSERSAPSVCSAQAIGRKGQGSQKSASAWYTKQ